ncbi:MAG: glycosyltransferase [Bacteroidales bacterium]
MNRYFLHELNKIRTNEQARLLNHALGLLQKTDAAKFQADIQLLKQELAILSGKKIPDENQLIMEENYDKLVKTLLNYGNENAQIDSALQEIQGIVSERKKFLGFKLFLWIADLFFRIFIIRKKRTSFARLYPFANELKKHLADLNVQFSNAFPGPYHIRALEPFMFLRHQARLHEGMISIILLCDGNIEHLTDWLDSFLENNSCREHEILVVDREASLTDQDIPAKYSEKTSIRMIRQQHKFTDGYLMNLAADESNGEFLLFLTVGNIFHGDVLTRFLQVLAKDSSIGIAGASVPEISPEQPDGNSLAAGGVRFSIEDIHGSPDMVNTIVDPELLSTIKIKASVIYFRSNRGAYVRPGIHQPCLVPVVVKSDESIDIEEFPAVTMGALFCRKKDFTGVGGFDLNYINGYEDIDLCLRLTAQFHKKIVTINNVRIKVFSHNFRKTPAQPNEKGEQYNLGLLVSNHGYFVKNRYLQDLAGSERKWTTDTPENLIACGGLLRSLMQASSGKSVSQDAAPHAERVIAGYIDGFMHQKFRIAIKIPPFNDDRAQFWGDFHFAELLQKYFIRKGHPTRVDLFESWYDQGYLTDEVVVILRGIKDYQPRSSQINILWNISHPEMIEISELNGFDHIFVASELFATELKQKHGVEAEVLLQCTDPEFFYPDFNTTNDKEKTDILYVANSRGVMRKSVEFAKQKGVSVNVYGTNWNKFLPPEMIKGNFIKKEDLRRYYSNCTILLNDHWSDMAEKGFVSNRIFDALACGAIILTDHVKGMENIFSEGIFIYHNADEMANQIKWIKNHLSEARQIAALNIPKISGLHTFEHRADRILEVVRQIHHNKAMLSIT